MTRRTLTQRWLDESIIGMRVKVRDRFREHSGQPYESALVIRRLTAASGGVMLDRLLEGYECWQRVRAAHRLKSPKTQIAA